MICAQCKHHRETPSSHWCDHPSYGVSIVSGEPDSHLCVFARSSLHGVCGPSGELFEQVVRPIVVQPAITVAYQVWYIRLWNWLKGVFK